jgi:hypothetical protein
MDEEFMKRIGKLKAIIQKAQHTDVLLRAIEVRISIVLSVE